jgi:hypothetical protein
MTALFTVITNAGFDFFKTPLSSTDNPDKLIFNMWTYFDKFNMVFRWLFPGVLLESFWFIV